MPRTQINEKDLELLEAGKDSYRSLAKKYEVPKSTIYDIHTKYLENKIAQHKRQLNSLNKQKETLTTKIQKLQNQIQERSSKYFGWC